MSLDFNRRRTVMGGDLIGGGATPSPMPAVPQRRTIMGGTLIGGDSSPMVASAYRAPAQPADPYGAFRPVADAFGGVASGIGGAIGGAVEGARRVPGVGGALDALSAIADATVRTPVGLAALGADAILGTGLSRAAQQRAAGRPVWEMPKFAAEELSGAFGKVAEDPRQDAIARLVAATARAGQTAGDFAAPVVPGVGAVKVATRAPRGAPLIERAAEVMPQPVAARAPVAMGATRTAPTSTEQVALGQLERDMLRRTAPPSAPAAAPSGVTPPPTVRIYGEMGTPARDPRDLGFGQVFRQQDPDVQALIQREAVEFGGFAAQRRGVRSIEQIKADADSAGLPFDELIRTPAGRAMNAEEMWSTVRAVGRAAQDRRAALDEVMAAGGPQHASTDQLARAVLASVQQASVQRVFAGARSEAGRSLRILREALTQAEIARDPTGYDKALAVVGGRQNAEQFVRRLVEINARQVPDQVKAQDTYRFLGTLGETGRWDQLQEIWINSILSNPITNIVNAVGNLTFAVTQPITRAATAGVDALSTVGGIRRPREVFFSEAAAQTTGMLHGIKDGARKAFHILRNGHSLDDVQRFVETGRMGRAQAIGGPVGDLLNLPTRGLGAMDAFFKTIGQTGELHALAARMAAREGLKGQEFASRTAELIANPTKEMWDAAVKQGKYVTFQSDLDQLSSSVMRMRNVTVPGTSLQPLRFVIPFIQTPTNLAKRGLEYSPAGFIRAVGTSGAERSTAVARAAVGTSILAFFAPKLLAGEMTGSAPASAAERDEFYRQGKLPFAVRIGDEWVEFRRLEPAFTHLRWMASIYDTWKQTGQMDGATMGKLIGAVLDATRDATYLQGIENLMNAIEDPERWGDRFLSRTVSGFVPYSGLLRGVAQVADPVQRAPEGPVESVAAGLPGLSQNVPARQDAFGREITRGPLDTGIGALVDPRRVSKETQDAVERELADVRKNSDLGALTFVGTKVGETKLSREQQHRYQQLAGEATYAALEALFGAGQYRAATYSDKAQLIERARDQAREHARRVLTEEEALPVRDRKRKTVLGG